MTVAELTRCLEEMRRQLDRLPETEEPPPTTLQLLDRSRQEGDWQQLLAYFLNPEAPHRLNHAVLEQFLRGLQRRDNIDFKFSRFDIENVQVATEVPVPDGRIDLLVWCEEKWFILCELKIDASEGDGQTKNALL
ncbi:PD-(D/E)XK nuclease family protein [Halorubrum sp. GN11_10-6_MGM]|uniref:PD-(D/E)XK nuclease family protein n=1 Tax=Halorubrum sp. GN11_10-6_MGM TaxID=2518112 RepID=UPI001F546799|nr:PD-(D/E)XK nuclease family protein [Halorubrum sp. GN11_10-6_MGM]